MNKCIGIFLGILIFALFFWGCGKVSQEMGFDKEVAVTALENKIKICVIKWNNMIIQFR